MRLRRDYFNEASTRKILSILKVPCEMKGREEELPHLIQKTITFVSSPD